ncbi:MAG: hypothetical protein IKX23_00580 [Treponema sp.]|nr:hypothetical protein [Treponema sp.]
MKIRTKNTVTGLIFLFIASVFFLSCRTLSVSSQAFLDHEGKPLKLNDCPSDLNINGSFPEEIVIKTMTQTFGFEYEFCLVEGKIWYKKRGSSKTEWKLYLETGLPFSRKNEFKTVERVVEIMADADCLYAFSSDGKLYRTYLKKITSYPPFEWVDYFGWPKKIQLYQNSAVKDKKGWAVGSSRLDVEYYTDVNGNEHNYGPLGVESITFLCGDGKSIRYSDPACPSDFSHSFKMPDDEAFTAVNISESASTIFLIGNDGTLYTRLVDYNTVGSDPMLYEYTYEKVKTEYNGSNKKSNTTKWALPNEPWTKQPRLPKDAQITKYITIIQNGKGNDARELRVAAKDSRGRTGYFYKAINETQWNFRQVELKLPGNAFLKNIKSSGKKTSGIKYTGGIWMNGSRLEAAECSVEDFDFAEGPFNLKIDYYFIDGIRSEDKKFYISEIWTPFLRLKPGYEAEPIRYFGTEENGRIHDYYIEATSSYLLIEKKDKNKGKIQFYLTSDSKITGNISIDKDVVRKNELLIDRLFQVTDDYKNEFGDDYEKIIEFENKLNKNKKNTSAHLKNGVDSAKVFAYCLLLNVWSKKVGIICDYSSDIVKYNKEFYKKNYELNGKYLKYMFDYLQDSDDRKQTPLQLMKNIFKDKTGDFNIIYFDDYEYIPMFVVVNKDKSIYRICEIKGGYSGLVNGNTVSVIVIEQYIKNKALKEKKYTVKNPEDVLKF